MGFKGSVESFSLADVFQNLAMNQQTGTLSVVASDTKNSAIYFKDGAVHAVSHGNGDSMPPLLSYYAHGSITQQHVQQVNDHAKANRVSYTDALLELGLVNEDQVREYLRLRVEEEVYDLFSWEKALFEFNEGEPVPGTFEQRSLEFATPLAISPLIMEAARRVDEWERLSEQVPSLKEYFIVEPMVRRAIEGGEMEMESFERRLIALMDGTRDVEDVATDSGLYKFEILNALVGFIQASIVRPSKPEELALAEQECGRLRMNSRRIKILERLLTVGGENARVRRELAELLAREQRVDAACLHFHILADQEIQAKRENGAMEIYRRILELSPKNVKGHERLAEIYAKRGQKKEATVHYNELFETYKDQNHMREARAAAVCALDCDPANSQLRGQLIEMLLSENNREDAARQYETLGDTLAKTGDSKGAADAYRRALQVFGTSNRLKKKLGDVMLTKEDRSSRTRVALIVVIALCVLGLIGGYLFYKDHTAGVAYGHAESKAQTLLRAAEADEKQGAFDEAKQKYNEALTSFGAVTIMFSPFHGYDKLAVKRRDEMRKRIVDVDELARKASENNARMADQNMEEANKLFRSSKIYEAREAIKKVQENTKASTETKNEAAALLEKIDERVRLLEVGQARLKKNPNEAFADVFEESAFKTRFFNDFESTGKLHRSELELPLQVKSETDNVKVYMDGKLVGSVGIGTDRAASTYRYPAVGVHTFEFKRNGYATVTALTSDLRAPLMNIKLQREPSERIDLRGMLGADTQLTGIPILYREGILTGASDGSLLHIPLNDKRKKPIRSAPASGPVLNRELYGTIHVVPRPGKSDLLVYATFSGQVIGLTLEDDGFKPAWPALAVTEKPLSAGTSVVKLAAFSGKSLLAVPSDKSLVLVELETGTKALGDKTIQSRARITSPAVAIPEDSALLAGCQDGKVYSYYLNEQPGKEWNTGSDASAIRATPIEFDNQWVVASENGQVYLFPKNRGGYGERIVLDNAGAIHDGLLAKRRYYCGTNLREGFWCVDLAAHRALWRQTDGNLGNILCAPALSDDTVYFGNDKGTIFAVDAERGVIKWTYAFDGTRPIRGSPLIAGKRIYFVNADGRILGFDE
jgi:outer membrane protein assembly factor BamB/tetratricopeptide (TPR) repeat protein